MKSSTLLAILTVLVLAVAMFKALGGRPPAASKTVSSSEDTEVVTATAADLAPPGNVQKSDADWKAQLSPAQYSVLRKKGTERSGSSPLLLEHRHGVFHCAACGLPLFASDGKFESGTGWPSFTKPFVSTNVSIAADHTLWMQRDEVVCARCGGHLGHVFDDGPPPTGRRFCMNGVALTFEPRP